LLQYYLNSGIGASCCICLKLWCLTLNLDEIFFLKGVSYAHRRGLPDKCWGGIINTSERVSKKMLCIAFGAQSAAKCLDATDKFRKTGSCTESAVICVVCVVELLSSACYDEVLTRVLCACVCLCVCA